jgi:hypothetical protein
MKLFICKRFSYLGKCSGKMTPTLLYSCSKIRRLNYKNIPFFTPKFGKKLLQQVVKVRKQAGHVFDMENERYSKKVQQARPYRRRPEFNPHKTKKSVFEHSERKTKRVKLTLHSPQCRCDCK